MTSIRELQNTATQDTHVGHTRTQTDTHTHNHTGHTLTHTNTDRQTHTHTLTHRELYQSLTQFRQNLIGENSPYLLYLRTPELHISIFIRQTTIAIGLTHSTRMKVKQ